MIHLIILPYCFLNDPQNIARSAGRESSCCGMISENPTGAIKIPRAMRTMSQLLDLAVFQVSQGGPLEHVIAAKAVAFGEILADGFTAYGRQVIANAQAMASLPRL